MIEIKLSQGAKPGHGGVLPKAKITAEIARTRGVPRDRDCVSPAAHSEFATPLELMDFISAAARTVGRQAGRPEAVRRPPLRVPGDASRPCWRRASRRTSSSSTAAEGGTGAAPVELVNHVGMPLVEGLSFVHNALVGAGLRERIKLGASGKIVSAYDICRAFALGADYVMSARGFMFAVGCIQSRSCHTNHCPTGVATQDPDRPARAGGERQGASRGQLP